MNEQNKRVELTAHQGGEEKPSAHVQSFDHIPMNLSPTDSMDGRTNKTTNRNQESDHRSHPVQQHSTSKNSIGTLSNTQTLNMIGLTRASAKEQLNQGIDSASNPQKWDGMCTCRCLERNDQRLSTLDWKRIGEKANNTVYQKTTETHSVPSYWNIPGIGKGPFLQQEFWQKAFDGKQTQKSLEKEKEEAPIFNPEGLNPSPIQGIYHSDPQLEQKKIQEKIR
ncbi:hypothetical protein KZZ20_08300 [Methylacidiphilum fumariolicum]|uniref:Uncharacterized protein n=2 Tax=Candidatus Methylacidiphilum fumarolicum TaxID=591154 RepID=I0K0M8_METFB|nr:hypothetical protein [Candidatus Methylacidiphilum fumarolicum]MBW6415509.1 hypothetical protein [Candidatus Methylacidiphilum fumarolicum]CCG93047.1 conserved hypothetical protein [Methylacidiphilum fumariolicum SolV]